ncbi:MAG: hypothetical protein ACKVOH_00475 [Chlamydiales bacterium]
MTNIESRYFDCQRLETIQKLKGTSQFGRCYVWVAASATGFMGAVTVWLNASYTYTDDPLMRQKLFWWNQVAGVAMTVLSFTATGCCLLRTSDADNGMQQELRAMEIDSERRAEEMTTEEIERFQQESGEVRVRLGRLLSTTSIDQIMAPFERKVAALTRATDRAARAALVSVV